MGKPSFFLLRKNLSGIINHLHLLYLFITDNINKFVKKISAYVSSFLFSFQNFITVTTPDYTID